jgi:hypothetical protein
MTTAMFELIYTSAATRLFDLKELATILEAARRNNARLSVSGILLYDAGSFIQVLEGEEAVVRALFDTIAGDSRHYRISMLRQGAISARSFAEWSMGFVTLDPALGRAFPRRHGLSSNGSLLDDESAVLEVLEGFRSGRWHSYVHG